MAKAKRVFEIARELGVKSKAIVEKCEAEDVPGVTNHMSTVKLGLEETIRQWFSDAADGGTAVETSEKVDLEKVARKKAKAKAKAKKEKEEKEAEEKARKEEEEARAKAEKEAAGAAEEEAEEAEVAEEEAEAE
ncbi:MAG: translation initiation factor IF-2 N-terminal domain-containing protein [Phycisphaeraceae bacterium]|nr:translation initiation factor IF-2 N-terminal domain-containing protein [Phycisphaeraceae bacterium]